MEKLRKMIDAYNKKAQKWGYDEIALENDAIKGAFVAKDSSGKGIMSLIKMAYRNGYLEEDYNNIVKRLSKILSTK